MMQQKLKLKLYCEEGLPESHFNFLTHDKSKKRLESLKLLYLVQMKVEELKQVLKVDNMQEVFVIPSTMCEDPTMVYHKVLSSGCHFIDLFTAVQDVDLELVKYWSKYVTVARESYLVENLLWSGAKIKASLTDELK